MRPFLALVLVLAPVLALAQGVTAVDVSNLAEGESLVVTKKAGAWIVRPFTLLTPGSGPTIPPTIPPGTLTPFQAEIQRLTKAALAKGGTETTGAGISSVYSLAADGLENKTLDVAVAADAVRRGSDAVVKLQKEDGFWFEFTSTLDATITTLRAKGDLKTKEQFAATFRDVAKGMDSATGFTGPKSAQAKSGMGILGNIDLAKLIELIKLIMELFKLFAPVMMP